jgi:hypothetical protein
MFVCILAMCTSINSLHPLECARHTDDAGIQFRGVQEYRSHEASREHVELAYEKIVSQSFRARQKKGYRASRGKRGERVKYEIPPTRLERLTGLVDPSVTLSSGLRDIVFFLVIGVWMSFVYPLHAAPTMLLFGYAVFRTTSKRLIRNPDGPYFGNSAVFGAVLLTVICMLIAFGLGGCIAGALQASGVSSAATQIGPFLNAVFLGVLNIFLK